MTTPKDIEEIVQDLAIKVTDYGYNDEYGYYHDWKDGVTPIIRKALITLVKQAFEEGRDISMKADEVLREEGRVEERERIVEYVQKAYCTQEHKDKHYCGFNDGEQVCDCYNEALDDLIAHLSEKQTEI